MKSTFHKNLLTHVVRPRKHVKTISSREISKTIFLSLLQFLILFLMQSKLLADMQIIVISQEYLAALASGKH